MPFIDFEEVKHAVSIEDAVQRLGLKVRKAGTQLRAPCPICKTGGDRALAITPAKNLFYCFAAQSGGDQLQLVAHVMSMSVKEAAEWLGGTSTGADVTRSYLIVEGLLRPVSAAPPTGGQRIGAGPHTRPINYQDEGRMARGAPARR